MLPFIIINIYQNDIVVLNNDCGSNSRQVSAKSMAINPRHVCHNWTWAFEPLFSIASLCSATCVGLCWLWLGDAKNASQSISFVVESRWVASASPAKFEDKINSNMLESQYCFRTVEYQLFDMAKTKFGLLFAKINLNFKSKLFFFQYLPK